MSTSTRTAVAIARRGLGRRPLSTKAPTREEILARRPRTDRAGLVFICRSTDGDHSIGRLLGGIWPMWRSTPVDVNYSLREWSEHERASRHLMQWGPGLLSSQTLRRLLLPDLALVAGASAAIVQHNTRVAEGADATYVEQPGWDLLLHPDQITLPLEPYMLSAFALGMLVTFRIQTCHARYVEGRTLWGTQLNTCRDLASRMLSVIPPDTPARRSERARAIRLLSTLALTLKYHLTYDGGNQHIALRNRPASDVRQDIDAALDDEVALAWAAGEGVLREGEAAAFRRELLACEPAGRPLHVLHELSAVVRRARDAGCANPVACQSLDDRLLMLCNVLGGCERLMRTPIYTPFTNHLSRFLLLWCLSIPAAMYPVVGPQGTPIVSVAVAWLLLGVEDIASAIEQPFDALPLWLYCDTVDQSVKQIEAHETRLRAMEAAQPV